MKKLEDLEKGNYIAFDFTYNGDSHEIMVTNITEVYEDKVLVHFLYGHHSLSEFIKKEDIIAIGNNKSTGKIEGWSGRFDILKPNHYLLTEK